MSAIGPKRTSLVALRMSAFGSKADTVRCIELYQKRYQYEILRCISRSLRGRSGYVNLVHKWQEIVNIIAEIIHVPSALVMKVEPPNIKVFVSSESHSNPYEHNELAPLNTGLYCETVMKTRQSLLVPDALRDEEWKSNPDIK